jgi:AcrR family transcriptional regulator
MDRRQEIYDTALAIFISHGYDNTPLSLIAKALGFTKANLYYYFQSKEELLFQIHYNYLEIYFIPILDRAEKYSEPKKRISSFMRNFTKILTSDAAARILIHEVGRLKPEHYQKVIQTWQRGFNIVRDAISEMQAKGEGRKINKNFAAFAAVGMCCWTFYWFDYQRKESEEELADTYIKLFFEGFQNDSNENDSLEKMF